MSNQKINVLIVEDESIVALDLSAGLEKDGFNVAGIADNAAEAYQIFSENDIDIVLMDINIIGEKNGIETAMDLVQLKQVPIIYLSAFSDIDTIQKVKNTYPAAFLTKPYNISNVRIAIELALNNFAIAKRENTPDNVIPLHKNKNSKESAASDKDMILQMNDSIFVKHNYRFLKIRLSELFYTEADNNYVHLFTTDKKITLRLSLNQLLEKINYSKIIRIHRSFAVNMDMIQSFNDQIVYIDKNELPIGRNYREDFLKNFVFK